MMKERLKQLLDSQAKKEKASSFLSIIGHEYDENYFSRLLFFVLANDPKVLARLIDSYIKAKGINSHLDLDSLKADMEQSKYEKAIGSRGRLDIYIEGRDALEHGFAIIIENKLYSGEGYNQTRRYQEWAENELDKDIEKFYFYFSLDKSAHPGSEAFLTLAYGDELADIFQGEGIYEQDVAKHIKKLEADHSMDELDQLIIDNTGMIKERLRKIERKRKQLLDNIDDRFKAEHPEGSYNSEHHGSSYRFYKDEWWSSKNSKLKYYFYIESFMPDFKTLNFQGTLKIYNEGRSFMNDFCYSQGIPNPDGSYMVIYQKTFSSRHPVYSDEWMAEAVEASSEELSRCIEAIEDRFGKFTSYLELAKN